MKQDIHLGFSGTRQGMTAYQQAQLRAILWHLAYEGTFPPFVGSEVLIEGRVADLHHGDCVGSDVEAHDLASEFRIPCHIHPPDNPKLRAYCTGDVHYKPLGYRERNEAIVRACTVLIAAPRSLNEQERSGTWMTIRFARTDGKPVIVLAPTKE